MPVQLDPLGARVSEHLSQREQFSQPSGGTLPGPQGPKMTHSDFLSVVTGCLMALQASRGEARRGWGQGMIPAPLNEAKQTEAVEQPGQHGMI